MDKIAKFLNKLSADERKRLAEVLPLLISGEIKDLNIKKLRGVDYIYRVRVGSMRIIYRDEKRSITILDISRRDEKTYREY